MLGKGSVVLVLSMEVVAGLWLCLLLLLFVVVVVGSSSVSIKVDSVREAEAEAGGLFGLFAGESIELSLVFVAERGERSGEEVVDSLRLWPWGE